MKAVMLIFAIALLLVAASLTVVFGQNKSVLAAKVKVVEAPQKKAVMHEQKVKKISENKIIKNKKKIEEIKVEKLIESKKLNGKYDKKVLTLEQKNSQLKKRSEINYTNNKSIWELIKRTFSFDVNALAIIESDNIMK